MIVPHQPPYSPDLAPFDPFLFPKLKLVLKGRRFDSTDYIKTNSYTVGHFRSFSGLFCEMESFLRKVVYLEKDQNR